MEFNKQGFDLFREDVENALEKVAEKHGVTVKCGGISYSDLDFSMQLKVIKNDSGDGAKNLFERYCTYYGFSKSDYEREFIYAGKHYKLVGFKTNARKNVCKILCLNNGKTYVCDPIMVRNGFEQMTRVS